MNIFALDATMKAIDASLDWDPLEEVYRVAAYGYSDNIETSTWPTLMGASAWLINLRRKRGDA